MNHDKDAEDSDSQAGTSNSAKRTQRPRDPRSNSRNHRFPPPHNNYNGDGLPQPSPLDFCQRPRPMHQCNGSTYSGNGKPPPAHWQYFMRHQPFGESARPYQFPPPPRFPQQFQFGTFPGRNSPRLQPWRDNVTPRASNTFPHDGRLHNNNSREFPKYVRPKTDPVLNGKKKPNKKKYSHEASKSRKVKKDGLRERVLDEAGLACDHGVDGGQSVHACQNGDADYITDNDGMKVSKSCDAYWLNEALSAAPVLESGVSDMPPVEEGAVGGAPVLADNNIDMEQLRHDSHSQSDKDLFDEGAIFDLDNIFRNHECSRKSDSNSDDDLDYVFDLEGKPDNTDKASLHSDDSESENGACGGKISVRHDASVNSWNGRSKNSSCRQCSSNDIVNNRIRGSRNGVPRNDANERDGSPVDSDLGEDTGDFIDTDLPSHTKHILSSSDEMESTSSNRESDEEDFESRLGSVTKGKPSRSDFNCNDLSTLEPNVLNGLRRLSMEKRECAESGISVFSNKRDSDNKRTPLVCDSYSSNCDLNDRLSPVSNSNVDRNSIESNGCDCGNSDDSQYNVSRPVSAPLQDCFKLDGSHSHSVIHGAAADIRPPRENVSCFPDHLGADCELQSIPGSFHQMFSNSRTCRMSEHDRSQRRQHRLSAEHTALSASGEQCPLLLNSLSQSCVIEGEGSASGSSTAEGSGGCCSYKWCQSRVNNLNSSHDHHAHGHVANGFNDDSSPNFTDDENNMHQKFPVAENQSTSLASAGGKELDRKTDLADKKMTHLMDNMSEGSEDPLNCDSNGDHVDMVLLPMEEEIEPVHYFDGLHDGEAVFDASVEDYGNMSGFHLPPFGNRQSTANSSRNREECFGPHIRDPISSGNRLPSKEFYELIKTVSATDSYMRFFDKDGQDVQRSNPKTCNGYDEDSRSGNPSKGKHVGRLSGTKADCLKVDRVMIWNEYEAYVVQYKQIAVSACGQTAILNVLKALKFQCDKSVVCKVIKTNPRKDDKDIPEYLFSRACAGTTAVELLAGVERLTGGVISGRFFHFWPPRKVKLLQWLAYWMKRGAIPMATLNLQQGPHSLWEVPDSWHHQMVYGVGHQGLYLTNPLEIVSERSANKQLYSDSVLLVRRQDIVSRFRESTDLGQLLDHPDPRWMSTNVLGQVVNVLRECNMPSIPGYRLQVTSHICIPASYQAGVTLFMRKDHPAWNALVTASELPLE